MRNPLKITSWSLLLLMATTALLGCRQEPSAESRALNEQATPVASAALASSTAATYSPIKIEHKLGTTVIEKLPQRVAALDMNEVDFLDQLNVPVIGMPKDFVPGFLAKYRDAPGIEDLGAIVQPNLEKVHAAKPDLILMTSLQANHYQELSQIARTVHFDVDYRNSQAKHIEVIKEHLLTLGRVFQKEELAHKKADELEAKVQEARAVTQGRPEKALVVMHNNGSFSSLGVQSRYGFVFEGLGVQPAGPAAKTGLHGEPVSSEFIAQTNPDIIYVVDRTAVMQHRPALNAETMTNPLLRQTNAWKNGRVVFVDPQAWYVTAAGPSSLKIVIDEVIKGYGPRSGS